MRVLHQRLPRMCAENGVGGWSLLELENDLEFGAGPGQADY